MKKLVKILNKETRADCSQEKDVERSILKHFSILPEQQREIGQRKHHGVVVPGGGKIQAKARKESARHAAAWADDPEYAIKRAAQSARLQEHKCRAAQSQNK